MNQKLIVFIPLRDSAGNVLKDKYGKPKTSRKDSKAGVRKKVNLIRDSQGTEVRTNLEIDIPKDLILDAGTPVEYIDVNGRKGNAVVVDSEDITNLTNTKVYYRLVYANG